MASVSIAGLGKTDVDINGLDGNTVSDVLGAALEVLGGPSGATQTLEPVVNGEDAEQTDTVGQDDSVSAAPRVRNG